MSWTAGNSAWLFLLPLAALVGFIADRTSVCTVKAIEEILTTGRAYMLVSFGKAALWVAGATIWLRWLVDPIASGPAGYAIVWTSVLGGLFFGVGAVLNRGCALATLKRLGNGDLGMIVSLAGFAAGVAIVSFFARGTWSQAATGGTYWIEVTFDATLIVGVVISTWMLWEAIRLWRTRPGGQASVRWRDHRFRLSSAAALIGISNGILYASLGTWTYTHTLRRSVTELTASVADTPDRVSLTILWILGAALLAGVVASALLNGRFALAWRATSTWRNYFAGGILMGVGAALVPGGNDVLLLNAIPGFSPHAIPAYAAVLLGVYLGLLVSRRVGGAWETIECRGDVCKIMNGGPPN